MMNYQAQPQPQLQPQLQLQQDEPFCSLCGFKCAEVKLLDCNCQVHVRCLPVHIFSTYRQAVESKRQDTIHIPCPSCSQKMNGFYIHKLSLCDLEQAAQINHNEYHNDFLGDNNENEDNDDNNRKRKRPNLSSEEDDNNYNKNDDDDIQEDTTKIHTKEYKTASASPFLLWSDSSSVNDKDQNDKLHFRTGRWSSAETRFVEILIHCFDHSTLPLPHGIKLNEFLKDILMCKSSRLTKKMKNAKLSHRNYKLIMATPATHDIREVSQAQQNFLDSIPSQVTRLVVKFNISRIWRLHFSNLCLQTGYVNVQGEDWLQSLEEFDKQVSYAETILRRHRRERLVRALRSDSFQDSIEGVYVGSPNIQAIVAKQGTVPRIASGLALSSLSHHSAIGYEDTAKDPPPTQQQSSTFEKEELMAKIPDESLENQIPRDLTITTIKLKEAAEMTRGSDNFSIDFLDNLDESLSGETYLSLKDTRQTFRQKNLFLSQIMRFLEAQNLPFHYIDCWIASECGAEQGELVGVQANQSQPLLRLVHAGDDIRSDLSSIKEFQLHEFGVYSKKFSFDPGAGLPGRCYSTLNSSWENNIQNTSPEHFKRLGGARYAGIMTALGIPIQYPMIGTIVIGLYSLTNISYNSQILQMCKKEFQKFNPEPRWNLSLDLSGGKMTPFSAEPSSGDLSNQSLQTVIGQKNVVVSSQSQASAKSKDDSVSSLDSISQEEVTEMENLLAEYISSEQEDTDTSDLIRSLRMQLLNFPDNIPISILKQFNILWRSYKGYCKVQRKKSDIVKLLISDWDFMSKSNEQKSSSPWGPNDITHVNYSSLKPGPNSNIANLQNNEQLNNVITCAISSATRLNVPPKLGGAVKHDPNSILPAIASSSNSDPTNNVSNRGQGQEVVSSSQLKNVNGETFDSEKTTHEN